MRNDEWSPRSNTTPLRAAFVTWSGLPGLSADDRLAAAALVRRGVAVEAAVWDDPAVPWSAYTAVIVRSTWDYHRRPAAFLRWIDRMDDAGVALWNPPALLRWNFDKGYLGELEQRGVAVVPTCTVPKGSTATLGATLRERGWDDVVVKPAVSASAYQTWRSSASRAGADAARFAALLEAGDVLVQPYQPGIEAGEWSFCFFGGAFSHAVLKRPRLGDFRVQSELGGTVSVEHPPPALLTEAAVVTSLIPGRWLYARVDACSAGQGLLLMELELIEPTLFFHADTRAADRFAEALRT
jgi:glutathione synthase/RimK-type ligase-like ATP-grasp enzyme